VSCSFFNFLALLPWLSFLWKCYLWYLLPMLLLLFLLWKCHLWYFCNLSSCLYNFGIACTIVGTTNGSTLSFIILCALTIVLSYSFFTLEPKTPPSSTLLFLLKAFLESLLQPSFCFQCYLHLIPSFFNLGRWFLWILLLMHK